MSPSMANQPQPELETPVSSARTDPRSLFYLPDELLVQTVGHLAADNQTLCSLARACRFFQIECEKHIYTTIELLSTSDLHAIIEAFTRRPERIASVETLKILYRFHDELGATAEERGVFNQCVAAMKALRIWHIESPYDNFKWEEGGDEWVLRDMDEFCKALEAASLQEALAGTLAAPTHVGLSKLERLVIHTHGASDDFWRLEGFHCLFRHPSLRYLHVSCLVLPQDLPELEPYAKSTPLTELIFDECELEPKSLGRILATPKKLRHLTLGENVYNTGGTRGTNPRLTRAPVAALAALEPVAHSLETLTHYDPISRFHSMQHTHVPIAGNGMRDFHSLHSLHVDTTSFLHRSIVLSHTQAPPNLATLQIRSPRTLIRSGLFAGSSSFEDFFKSLPPYEPYTYLASLNTLDFVQGKTSEMATATSGHICEQESLRERHAYAYKLFKHKINLKVTLEATFKNGLIPPFLHGEPLPEQLCVYDAAQVGFRRHVVAEENTVEGEPPSNPDAPPESDTEGQSKEPQETDQLSESDILSLKNEVRRSLEALWDRMRRSDALESNDSEHVDLDSDDDDDDDIWEDTEDDDEGLDWVDADEFDVEDDELTEDEDADDLD